MENPKYPKEYTEGKVGFIRDPFKPEFLRDSRGRFFMPLPGYAKAIGLGVEPGSRNIAQSTESAGGDPQTDPGSLKSGYIHAETALKVGPKNGWVVQLQGGDSEYPISYFNESSLVMNFYVDRDGNVYLKGKLVAGPDSEVDWMYLKNISVLNVDIGEVLTVGNTEADVTQDSNFVNVAYPADQAAVQIQIDGKIVSWFTGTDPSGSWTGTDASHAGDMWWNTSTKRLKRYSGTAWSIDIEDQLAIDAYTNAATAQDTADGKRRVFVNEPTTPYDIGDLWAGGPSGVLKRCKTARASGAYQAGDWELALDALSAGDVGAMAYEDVVELAKLGTTVVQGGYLQTILIDAQYIQTGILVGRTIKTSDSGSRIELVDGNDVWWPDYLVFYNLAGNDIGNIRGGANDVIFDGTYLFPSGIGLSYGCTWEGGIGYVSLQVWEQHLKTRHVVPLNTGFNLGDSIINYYNLYLSGTAFLSGKMKIPVGTNLY